MKNVLAIYPGSFDPVTNGHLDLIERGTKIFDRLVVSILRNFDKEPLFTIDERVEMLREVTRSWANVEVDVFSGLLVDYARLRQANGEDENGRGLQVVRQLAKRWGARRTPSGKVVWCEQPLPGALLAELDQGPMPYHLSGWRSAMASQAR